MTEIVNSMKLIKMYAWETPFLEAVKGNNIVSYLTFNFYHNIRIPVFDQAPPNNIIIASYYKY